MRIPDNEAAQIVATGFTADGRFAPGNQVQKLRKTKASQEDYLDAIRQNVSPEAVATDIERTYNKIASQIEETKDADDIIRLTGALTKLLPYIVGKLPGVKPKEDSDDRSQQIINMIIKASADERR